MVFFIIQERPVCLTTDQYVLELLNGSTDFFDKREQTSVFLLRWNLLEDSEGFVNFERANCCYCFF